MLLRIKAAQGSMYLVNSRKDSDFLVMNNEIKVKCNIKQEIIAQWCKFKKRGIL